MTEENRDYHENNALVLLAKKLGLDPATLTDMQVEGDSGSDVCVVRWQGESIITVQEFEEILEQAADDKVSRSSM